MDDLTTTIDDTPATTSATSSTNAEPSTQSDAPDTTDLLDDELLVEEISIDGMCGVY